VALAESSNSYIFAKSIAEHNLYIDKQ
jgi:hypothetical protein